MSRYFFHLRSAAKSLIDWAGVDLADDAAARREALVVTRDFVQRPSGRVEPAWADWSVEVRDRRGRLLFAAPIAQAAGLELDWSSRSPKARSRRPDRGAEIAYLNLARALRNFHETENQARMLHRETSALIDRQRHAARTLHQAMGAAREVAAQSRRAVLRSQSQPRVSDWHMRAVAR
jgi:hypothetical protein